MTLKQQLAEQRRQMAEEREWRERYGVAAKSLPVEDMGDRGFRKSLGPACRMVAAKSRRKR
jgi:hypothetical protein